MGQGQRSGGLNWPKGHDIGRWAHANVKLHFFCVQSRETDRQTESDANEPVVPIAELAR